MGERNHVCCCFGSALPKQLRLSEYALGVLRGRAKERVERHLAECHACRAEVAALERTGALLNSVGMQDAPARTWEAIRQRIEEPSPLAALRRPRACPERSRRGAWALAMGAIALALVVFGFFFRRVSGALWARPPYSYWEPRLAVAVEPDEEMQATIEGHLSTIWAAPLADEAAVGLRLAALESDG